MPDYVEWTRSAFDRHPEKKKKDLADVLEIDKSAVTRLLKGERRIQLHELKLIADFFGEPIPPEFLGSDDAKSARANRRPANTAFGFAEDAAAFEGRAAVSLAPVIKAQVNDSGEWLISRHLEPIDYRPRAPHFRNAAMVFGFYVPNDDAAPRFKAGEVAWIDPARPASVGEDAAMIERKPGAPQRVILGEMKRSAKIGFVIRLYPDRRDRSFEAAEWEALHVLPRY